MTRKAPWRNYKLNQPSEGVRIHAEEGQGYPVEVFGDHGLCAGHSMLVYPMSGPHMHSQVELNYVISGSMTYWFDGQDITLSAGRMALFWGMVPHRVTDREEGTEFVVLYAPMSRLIELTGAASLREAVFSGGFVEAKLLLDHEEQRFRQWRLDLLQAERMADKQLAQIVQDELNSRIRRIERDGWHDLRGQASLRGGILASVPNHERAMRVERMARYISENSLQSISVEDVADAAHLHPNYAMSLYKSAMGMSIKQSIIRHRLDTAQSLLISSDTPVSKAGLACGFGSVSSFYAAFEKRFGVSPLSFRQSIRAHQAEMASKIASN
jgi:AraC family transcriptional regulator, melibiose operon regulatory protein